MGKLIKETLVETNEGDFVELAYNQDEYVFEFNINQRWSTFLGEWTRNDLANSSSIVLKREEVEILIEYFRTQLDTNEPF